MVFASIAFTMEIEVMLDRPARKSSFLILSWRNRRSDRPKGHKNRNGGEQAEKEPCEEAAPGLARQIGWDYRKEGEKNGIREGFAAGSIGW
jgi:hypothetical protein